MSSMPSRRVSEKRSSWDWRHAGSSTPEYLISWTMQTSCSMEMMSCSALDLQRQDLRDMVTSNLSSSVAISPANRSVTPIVAGERKREREREQIVAGER